MSSWHHWSWKNRPFGTAATSYLERAEFRGPGVSTRARAELKKTQRKLATAERRKLIFQFSHFVSLARFAGLDAFEWCYDPPVLPSEVRQRMTKANRDWVVDDTFCDPRPKGYCLLFASLPGLCCLGYLISEVVSTALLSAISMPLGSDVDADARAINKLLVHELAEFAKSTGTTSHEFRQLTYLMTVLIDLYGDDVSIWQLEDDQVVALWTTAASKEGPGKFVKTLECLAALSAEIAASYAESGAESLDDPDFAGRFDTVTSQMAFGDDVERVLGDWLTAEFMNGVEIKTARQQLCVLAPLVGLDLSRARAMTFGPVENRLVQGKRDREDLDELCATLLAAAGHTTAVARLLPPAESLEGFLKAALYGFWNSGRRTQSLRAAVVAGWISVDDAVRLRAAGPDKAFADLLSSGLAPWTALRRRKAFAALDEATLLDRFEDALSDSAGLRAQLLHVHARLSKAVGLGAAGDRFVGELDPFCGALAKRHGVEWALRSGR